MYVSTAGAHSSGSQAAFTRASAGTRGSGTGIATRVTWAMLLIMTLVVAGRPAAGAESAGRGVPVTLGTGSVLWLEGTSSMHDYTSKTTQVSITLSRDPAAAAPSDAGTLEALIRGSGIRGVDVVVPVRSLHSEKSGLDKNLWKTLKAEQHPSIRFHLTKYVIAPKASVSDTLRIRAEGTLEVAGVTCPATLEGRAYRGAQGVWLEGSEPLLMSDFGMKPPKMMMGALKVKDPVIVHYKLLLVPASAVAVSPKGDVR